MGDCAELYLEMQTPEFWLDLEGSVDLSYWQNDWYGPEVDSPILRSLGIRPQRMPSFEECEEARKRAEKQEINRRLEIHRRKLARKKH